jgi:predicted DNA binding CopG/RHH family protein
MTDKAVINIDIPQELYDKAKEEAKRLGIPLAGFVRQLMVQYFEKKA